MLSVVIPTLNAAHTLPHVLEQVRALADDIVISDGGSTDETLGIAVSARARIALGNAGRGWQLARGAQWACQINDEQDWLLFLHADARLDENWFEAVQNHIETHGDKAGYFRFKFDDKGWKPRLIEQVVGLRCRFWHLPYGDQGLLISRALYEGIGGYPKWNVFEDVKIMEALRGKLRRIDADLYTDAGKYKAQGYWRRAWENFQLYKRYKKGLSPEQLAAEYYP